MVKKAVMGEASKGGVLTLYFVRHGETALNADGRLRGWSNPPLNSQGRAEAREVSRALETIKLTKVYCSDLVRAKKTADAILVGQTCSLQPTQDLRPINFGDWNGKPLSEVEPKMVALQEKWRQDPDIKAPGGESFDEFQMRQMNVLEAILKKHKPGEHVAIVAHLRNCIWALCMAMSNGTWLHGDRLDMLNRITQQVCRVSVITYSEKDGFKILAASTVEPETEDSSPSQDALKKRPQS